ncbi:hypothetical protein VTN77DRAFT_424 [Rasamsonia byssochlamydoides]|uniref:uncharacterized protein n=1 Tax=Rasamsonia byssochlamydoides TaxID=89139 RepID=UPI003741F706
MADLSAVTSSNFFWPGVVCALVLLYIVSNAAYNLFFSPLSRFPGPKLWAISRIPFQVSVLRGHPHFDVTALHERYGPVVRLGPNELAFNTPQAFRDIYGSRAFAKDRSHYSRPPNGVDHIVSAVDDGIHARQRRLLSHAFSDRALRDQEPLITGFVDTLIRKLREKSRSGENENGGITEVDIKNWINYTGFDITGDLMFGESFDCLKDSQLHPWIELIFYSMKMLAIMGVVNQFPLLDAVLQKLIPRHIKQKALDHFNFGAAKVDRRLKMETDRPDFISALLQNGLSEEYGADQKMLSREEIHSNAFILIIAGSEASAALVSGCIYYLCKSADVMHRLVSEIRTAFTADDEITFSKATQLPYVAAVIEESLRVYPPFVTTLYRVTPAGGAMVDGHFVPENTIVACHHYASYHSSSNFALPNEFIPERWLGTDPRFESDRKDVLNPFSLGPRSCLGKKLAYAEIRLMLCKLLFNFEIELCPESSHWVDDQEVYFIWDKPALTVTLTDRFRKG